MEKGRISGSPALAVGIDLGGTNVRAALIDEDGNVLARNREETPKDAMPLQETIIRMVKEISGGRAQAVVLAAAGLVDPRTRRILRSPNLEAIVDLPVVEALAQALSIPVGLVNDAAAAAVGEKWKGAGQPFDNFVLLTLGTGIGGGVIHKGRLLDIAAELGHMSINAEGPACQCGRRGCLESYASATAIVDRAVKELMSGRESLARTCCDGNYYKVTAEIVFRTAMEGDMLCREIIKDAALHLGTGVANLVNIFSPEAVIFSGGLLGAWQFIQPELQGRVARLAFKPLDRNLKLLTSTLGDDAGVLGAACLGFDLLAPQNPAVPSSPSAEQAPSGSVPTA